MIEINERLMNQVALATVVSGGRRSLTEKFVNLYPKWVADYKILISTLKCYWLGKSSHKLSDLCQTPKALTTEIKERVLAPPI